MSERAGVLVLALALLLGGAGGVGCGGSQARTLPDGPLVDAEGAGFDPTTRTPLEPGEDRGTLERETLEQVLLGGPQAFISQVRVTPASIEGKFVGFRLEELTDPRFAGVDLHPGDIITHVNGRPIEQPDQFMKIWEDLKVAPELRIEYRRGAAVRVLRWQIVDSRSLQPTLVP